MRIKFKLPASEDTLFAPESFNEQIGKSMVFEGYPAKILSVVVDASGKSAEIEIDCPELTENTSLYWDITRGKV